MSGGTSRSSGSRGSSQPHANPKLHPPATAVHVALTPLDVLQNYELPLAVHLKTPTPSPRGVDTKKPILLYKNCDSVKVQAESLRTTSDGRLVPVGPILAVPDNYTGWFSIVGNRGSSATCFSTIAQVAKSRPSCFLTRYELPAYSPVSSNAGADPRQYSRGSVQGGEVLKLISSSASSEDGLEKYIQCINYKKEVVLIPLSATGRFYITAQKTSTGREKVYLMSQIRKKFQFPVTVKLVCGYMPKTPCAFTGVLRLQKCQKESVILACTMTSKAEATFMEMDLQSNFLLAPVLDPLFNKSPIFLKTLSYCDDEANEWQRQIKVTHHVTERRSRSLTRSFSDKFVDTPLAHRPLSLSSLTNLERSKSKTPTGGDNHIGKLASKVKKIKETKKKENAGKENDAYVSSQISGSRIFEKHRKLSKQNTYVKDISRISNRPLPDPHEKETEKRNRLNIRESLNSLKKYKIIKNRPLPKPNEDHSEERLASNKYKLLKSPRDKSLEYCRVFDEVSSPLPEESLLESEEEDYVENLYSEIDDYSLRPMHLHENFEDEENDSANYSNENSSKENSVDKGTNEKVKRYFKSQGVIRSFQIQAMIHDLQSAGKEEEENEEAKKSPTVKGTSHLKSRNFSKTVFELEDQDSLDEASSIDGDLCDSLEDLPSLLPVPENNAGSKLKTYVDEDGTLKKKYYARQRRNNIYETLEDVKKSVENLKLTNEINEIVDKNDATELDDAEDLNTTPYTSMITMINNDNSENQTSICIMKQSTGKEHKVPDLEMSKDISTRGNTILIKVLDDATPSIHQDSGIDYSGKKSKLKKCSSVSSINILLDDNEDDIILSSQEKEFKNNQGLHRKYPSMVTITEPVRTVDNKTLSDASLSISIPEQDTNFSGVGIEILSSSHELIINCNGDTGKRKPSRDSDSKSVDSGNATDEVEVSEDSFDNDSLDDESDDFRKNSNIEIYENSINFDDDCNTQPERQAKFDEDIDNIDSQHSIISPNDIFNQRLRSLVDKLTSGDHATTPSLSAVPYHEMLPPLPEVDEERILEFIEENNGSSETHDEFFENDSPFVIEPITSPVDGVEPHFEDSTVENPSREVSEASLKSFCSSPSVTCKETIATSAPTSECASNSDSENQSIFSATDSGVSLY